MDDQHACIVVMGASVVSAGCDGDELSSSEVVDSVLADLMTPNDHADLVHLDELFNDVWAVVHDVVLLSGISDLVP